MQWFDIIIKNKKLKEQIKKKFESLNIGYREFWNPVNSHNLYKKIKCFGDNSYEISKFGIWLPSNFDLSESDIRTVCDVIKVKFKNEIFNSYNCYKTKPIYVGIGIST